MEVLDMTAATLSAPKRGRLTGGALTDDAIGSSRSVLRRGRDGELLGLQQIFTPPVVGELAALVHGSDLPTLDPTAGDGALLAPLPRSLRFGIEVDRDQLAAGDYLGIAADLQQAAPLLRLLGARWPRIVANPPFGLDWTGLDGTRISSTEATWEIAQALLEEQGCGLMITGRDRFHREIARRADAAGVYALLDVEDLFDGVTLPTTLAWFVHPGAVRHPRPGGPLQLTATREELLALAPELLAERERVAPLAGLGPDQGCVRLQSRLHLVARQIEHQRLAAAARRPAQDISLAGGSLRVQLSPLAAAELAQRSGGVGWVERLDRQPLSYFGLAAREWRQLRALAEEGVVTFAPGLADRVERAIADAALALCPLYEVEPQMRLGWLEDLDSIRCTRTDPDRGFLAGETYRLIVSSDVRLTYHERPVDLADGDVEVRRYEREALVMRVRIGEELFNESPQDIAYLLDHFEIPDPGDLATRYPEEVAEARQLLRELADAHGFAFKSSPQERDRDWQVEDLARLLVKGRGELCWEQGGGKSLGGLALIHASWERGAARRALIVAPQDLIPQWTREARRFFQIEPTHITSPAQARAVARHLAAGGEGLYITHYEVLSVVGRTEEPLPETVLKLPVGHPDRGRLTSRGYCPACHATHRSGWRRHSRHACAACGYVHKRLKIPTAARALAQAFRRGVIVVDEGTAAKGDSSLRSKAIRGLRARHSFLLTGTPVSNFVHDVFWLLWWARGDSSIAFPFSAHGGRGLFEEQFCVREWYRDADERRAGRKVLPIVTNLSRLWRLLASGMVRRRMDRMGTLPPCTIKMVTAPMGAEQAALTRFWLDRENFASFFAYRHPSHPMIGAGLVDKFAAMLGQLTKLEYAATMPEADPDRDWIEHTAAVELTNWTPKNVKLLQIALDHARRGEKVLIGSDLIATGRWFAEQLQAKGVNAAHLVETGGQTASPGRRARLIDAFQNGETQILCCGIQAVRQGHSLSAASVVIVNGLVYSYEQLAQFIARARRLTSRRPITVYLGAALGTIDVTKIELNSAKNQAADLALDGKLVDQPEEPISLDRVLRDLIRRGLTITGTEIPGTALKTAWEREPHLPVPASSTARRPSSSVRRQPVRRPGAPIAA
jgi:SNF2-related domain